MKAVIVDLKNHQAAALCDDGRVIRLADAGYTLGQIVEVHARKRRTPLWLRYASTAAAAALLLVGAGGGAAYAMPYGVVSLDVNPSLEYTINRFDYVLSVEGVNEDGRALLEEMDVKQLVHHRIGEAIEASVEQLEAGDWLGGESDEILISAGTKQPEHAEKLLTALEDDLYRRRESLEVHAVTVSEEEIDAAHQDGMSAGRHRMLDTLRESEGAAFEADEWAERPIRDIFHRLENGPDTDMRPDMDSPRSGEESRRPGDSEQARPEIEDLRPAIDRGEQPQQDWSRENDRRGETPQEDARVEIPQDDPRGEMQQDSSRGEIKQDTPRGDSPQFSEKEAFSQPPGAQPREDLGAPGDPGRMTAPNQGPAPRG